MNKKKILLVDDEKALSLILKKCLEQTGIYEVVVENNSNHAVAMTRDFKPDLVLLDIMMPEINGFEIAEHLQNDSTLNKIKIVFFTALPNQQNNEIQENNRERVFINKPVKLDKLLECFEEQLD
ncbi:MAG TPA: response regulator [Thiotrichaceae bacterium]|jgi:CheY-like chemotaxis protein|nr:response regulator [Thiotrichaceae bacterium]HIM08671.1 response regulator [Gammaproteobacteria bacterium]